MKKSRKLIPTLCTVLLIFLLVACQSDDDETPVGESQAEEQNDQQPQQQQGGTTTGLIAKYTVSGDGLSLIEQGTNAAFTDAQQQVFWQFFTNLIPQDLRAGITQLVLFADEEDGTAAYVAPLSDDDLSKWEMGFNFAYVWDESGQLNKGETAYTSIHEVAHVLTLNSGQVNVNGASCSTFHTGEGCSNPGAYINLFFDSYWKDIFGEHQSIEEDDTEAFYAFYEKYKDRFVSEYAATNPGEDIAESFTNFVLKGLPTGGSIADQKMQFFYNYEGLVAARQKIRGRIDFNVDIASVAAIRSARFSVKSAKHF